jgi:hypothetical protein
MRKDAPNYWKNKYRELLEKHVRLGEAILQAIKNIEPKNKTKPPKTIALQMTKKAANKRLDNKN